MQWDYECHYVSNFTIYVNLTIVQNGKLNNNMMFVVILYGV